MRLMGTIRRLIVCGSNLSIVELAYLRKEFRSFNEACYTLIADLTKLNAIVLLLLNCLSDKVKQSRMNLANPFL